MSGAVARELVSSEVMDLRICLMALFVPKELDGATEIGSPGEKVVVDPAGTASVVVTWYV